MFINPLRGLSSFASVYDFYPPSLLGQNSQNTYFLTLPLYAVMAHHFIALKHSLVIQCQRLRLVHIAEMSNTFWL